MSSPSFENAAAWREPQAGSPLLARFAPRHEDLL